VQWSGSGTSFNGPLRMKHLPLMSMQPFPRQDFFSIRCPPPIQMLVQSRGLSFLLIDIFDFPHPLFESFAIKSSLPQLRYAPLSLSADFFFQFLVVANSFCFSLSLLDLGPLWLDAETFSLSLLVLASQSTNKRRLYCASWGVYFFSFLRVLPDCES